MLPSISKVAVAFLLLATAGCQSGAFVLPATTVIRVTRDKSSNCGQLSFVDYSLGSASLWTYSFRYKTTLHYLHRPDSDTSSVDFYVVLGISRDATESEIKAAFRKLAKLYHPDANPDRDTTKQFQILNRAYEVLRDPKLKKAYDVYGSKGIGTSASSDIDNLKREQARRRQQRPPSQQSRPSNPSTTSNYYSGNSGFGSAWPSSGTGGTSPFANRRASETKSVSVDNAGFDNKPSSSSRSPRSRMTDPNPVGSRSAGPGRTATGATGPNTSNPDTFRVDKSIFETKVRSSPRPGNSSSRRASTSSTTSTTTTSSGRDFQTGPKPHDSTAYYGDMGPIHAQSGKSGNGYSDNSMFGPNDGIAFTCGVDFFGRGPKFGRDVLMDVEIDMKTANSGGTKWIEVRHKETCTACHGVGTKDPSPSKISSCSHCGGSGHTTNASQMRETCSACSGTGRIVSNPCDTCKGSGMEEIVKSMQIVIPKQIDDGFTLRIPGQGDVGPNDGPAGDLYVCFSVPEMKKRKAARAPETAVAPKASVVRNKNTATTTVPRPRAVSLKAQTVVPAPQTVVSPPSEPRVRVEVVPPSPTASAEPKKKGLRGFFGGFVAKVRRK